MEHRELACVQAGTLGQHTLSSLCHRATTVCPEALTWPPPPPLPGHPFCCPTEGITDGCHLGGWLVPDQPRRPHPIPHLPGLRPRLHAGCAPLPSRGHPSSALAVPVHACAIRLCMGLRGTSRSLFLMLGWRLKSCPGMRGAHRDLSPRCSDAACTPGCPQACKTSRWGQAGTESAGALCSPSVASLPDHSCKSFPLGSGTALAVPGG